LPEINPAAAGANARNVLHRPLDVDGHSEGVLNSTVVSTNETYQDANGQHLWTLKRFPGVAKASSSDNNPEEVE
jgi:hypothetical protein